MRWSEGKSEDYQLRCHPEWSSLREGPTMPLVRSCGMKAVEEQRRFARRVLPSTLQGGLVGAGKFRLGPGSITSEAEASHRSHQSLGEKSLRHRRPELTVQPTSVSQRRGMAEA